MNPETPLISLCIPTMNRWEFLKTSLPRYLENPDIDEIVISDENGADVSQIQLKFGNNSKLKLFSNERTLGAFGNKIRACRKASNQCIALIDSDNFADEDYFQMFLNYVGTHGYDRNTIYAPENAKTTYHFRDFSGVEVNRTNFKTYALSDQRLPFNTGNYILSRRMIEELRLEGEEVWISSCAATDVFYMNYLFIKQLDARLLFVPNLAYVHIVHEGSYWMNTSQESTDFLARIKERIAKEF